MDADALAWGREKFRAWCRRQLPETHARNPKLFNRLCDKEWRDLQWKRKHRRNLA